MTTPHFRSAGANPHLCEIKNVEIARDDWLGRTLT
jgi:hypothetical protein